MTTLIHRLRRLARGERATSLTEFAIMLPILIMVLVFMMQLGMAGQVISDASSKAHRHLWTEVLSQDHFAPDFASPGTDNDHIHPARGAAVDEAYLPEHTVPVRHGDAWNDSLYAHEEATYEGLRSGGHWGESHQRTRPVAASADLRGPTGDEIHGVADEPQQIVGGSGYARGLIDDGTGAGSAGEIDMSAASSPSGVSSLGHSVAPALGAGIRYGVVHHVEEGVVELPRDWSLEVRKSFDVLAPPQPLGSDVGATAVSRARLDEHAPYSRLLGIADHQRLTGTSTSPPAAPPVTY